MAEPLEIVAAIETMLDEKPKPLAGRRIIVTSGPTHEPIDPVRYIANRSSRQAGPCHRGRACATRCRCPGLVSGPVNIADPAGVATTHVETAAQMKEAVESLLPADAAVFVAAVADWRTANAAGEKIKKVAGKGPPSTADGRGIPISWPASAIIAQRPGLVVGFAAETQDLIANAEAKLKKKGADFIVANDVSHESGIGPSGVMGGDRNKVRIVSKTGVEEWPEMGKDEVAARLAALIAERLATVVV
ncbi:phosphopantothenoylcysteine decarboxylase domain-containing protein [Mesorhizobium atlanticum]